MTFDLFAYAKSHGLRVRNVADGRACPAFVPAGDSRSRGYSGCDRCDAIVGRYGYITAGRGRLEWVTRLVSEGDLTAAGATIVQAGEDEAAGYAPYASLERLLQLIQVARLAPETAPKAAILSEK